MELMTISRRRKYLDLSLSFIRLQGAIIPGSAWLEFHFEGAARSSLCIAKPLDSLSAAAEFMAVG